MCGRIDGWPTPVPGRCGCCRCWETHRYWPGPELADRLGVSVRTLRRDVDRLRELGYPVDAQRGVEGGYQLAAGAALPPLVVDDDEAVALAVGLQAAAQGTVAGIAESSVRALAKIVQVMPPKLRHRVQTLGAVTEPARWGEDGATVDPGALTTVWPRARLASWCAAQACRDAERLEFGYTAADGARTDRLAEPHRLVSLGRRWYLVAYDLHRHDWRSFRLDRLADPRRTGARFRPRELSDEDAAAFVRAGLRNLPAAHSVEVLVHALAEGVRAQVGRWAEIEEVDGARCLLRMTTDSLDWPLFALGGVGAEFEVRSPPELVDRTREWGARFGRAAG